MNKDRHTRVEVKCQKCGTKFLARVERVNKGQGRFCGKLCFDEWQRETIKSSRIGKENAKTYPNAKGGYFVQWIENGKAINLPWHIWTWEMNFGPIPTGHVVEYIDGNKKNITLENLQLRMTRKHKQSLPKQRKVLSPEHRQKLSESLKNRWREGKFDNVKFSDISRNKNPHWRDGSWGEPYPKEFYKIKDFIKSRDNYKCQICGKDVSGKRSGHIHHRDGNKNNNDQNNLLTLCASCHSRVHTNSLESPPIMALRSELHWSK